MKKGRAKNFTGKLAGDLSVADAAMLGRIGDPASTAGAKLVQDFQTSILWLRINPTRQHRAVVNGLLDRIGGVVQHDDSKTLREMADFIDAARRVQQLGYANPGFSLAASYVHFCQGQPIRLPADTREKLCAVPTLKTALEHGAPHTPSVAKLCDHLAFVMGDEAPSYKTTERWARQLGIVARSRRSTAK